MAVGEAVTNLLRAAYDPADFSVPLEFRTITARQFSSEPPAAGISLFLYRVTPNGVHRTPAGRFDADGQRRFTQLPLDLHFLLTIWGAEATLQHAITGWAMRVLEDTPLLGAGTLNAAVAGSFRADESIEFALAELANEDLLRIWEVLGLHLYQLSIPYVARCVRLESIERLADTRGPPVQTRVQAAGIVVDAPSLQDAGGA